MVRKTKAQAQATRHHILDAAEQVFLTQGVARTSLQHVAAAAGVTRGAIYWHFEDKADLFAAMMERVSLPFEAAMLEAQAAAPGDPQATLLNMGIAPLKVLATQAQVQRVFTIAKRYTEYTDELALVSERRREGIAAFVALLASQMARLTPPDQARAAALGLFALVDGLMRQWTLEPASFDLLAVGEATVSTYLRGLGVTGR